MMSLVLILSFAHAAPLDVRLADPDFQWEEFALAGDSETPNAQGWTEDGYSAYGSGTGAAPTPDGYGQVVVDLNGTCGTFTADVEVCGFTVGSPNVEVCYEHFTSETWMPDTQWTQVNSVRAWERNTNHGIAWCTTPTIDWRVGHEQELPYVGVIEGLDQAACESGAYDVAVNSHRGELTWCPAEGACMAHVGRGTVTPSGCTLEGTGRGVYFPVASKQGPHPEQDGVFWYDGYPQHDFEQATGNPIGSRWAQAMGRLPYHGALFDTASSADDHYVRYLLAELRHIDDEGETQVLDRSRTTYYFQGVSRLDRAMSWHGPNEYVAGAWSALTPNGLAALAPVHESTLPYPSAEAFVGRFGAQGVAVIEEPLPTRAEHRLTAADDYWVDPRSDWQGAAAYQSALNKATNQFLLKKALEKCANTAANPTTAAACAASAALICVDEKPAADDFVIRVDAVDLTIDTRANPAFDIDGVSGTQLAFGNTSLRIDTSLQLDGLTAVLQGDLLPHTTVAYDAGALCATAPKVALADATDWTLDDPEGWGTCYDLETAGSMHADVDFDLSVGGLEHIDVSFASSQLNWIGTPLHDASRGGTCSERWLQRRVRNAMPAYDAEIERLVEEAWVASPSQDEALDRLLSPLEIGMEYEPAIGDEVLARPLYDMPWYRLSAVINADASNRVPFVSHPSRGLLVPYFTRAVPEEPTPKSAWWKWACFSLSDDCPTQIGGWQHLRAPTPTNIAGQAFDVAMHERTAFVNQRLWAQSHHPELLGHAGNRHELAFDAKAFTDGMYAAGFRSLADYGELRAELYATVPPFVHAVGDEAGFDSILFFAAPQMVVELVDPASKDEEPVARFLLDVFDRNVDLAGVDGDRMQSAFSPQKKFLITTVHFPEGCTGTLQTSLGGQGTCEEQLRGLVAAQIHGEVEGLLLTALDNSPMPGVWDAAGEAQTPMFSDGGAYTREGTQQQAFSNHGMLIP